MGDDPQLMKKLRERARKLGAAAVDEFLSDDRRADAVGAAVRRVQEGRRMLDERSARMLSAMGFATQSDLDRVSRKVGRLRKRLRVVLDRLETS